MLGTGIFGSLWFLFNLCTHMHIPTHLYVIYNWDKCKNSWFFEALLNYLVSICPFSLYSSWLIFLPVLQLENSPNFFPFLLHTTCILFSPLILVCVCVCVSMMCVCVVLEAYAHYATISLSWILPPIMFL